HYTSVKRLPTALSTAKSLSHRRISCARIGLSVPLAKLFDYALPDALPTQVGDRVVVPFGSRQQLGIVLETDAASELPAERMKSIAAVRDDAPRLPPEWLPAVPFFLGSHR